MLPLESFTSNSSRYSAFSMLVGDGGIDVEYGIAYGTHPRQKLDVYRPRRSRSDLQRPVALFLYGGSWKGGCRSCYGFVGAAFAAQGIATAVADYRLFPEVKWPTFQEDAAEAFRWTHRVLADNGHRPAIVIGHSAGAHMAALLAADRRWLGNSRPSALVGLAGPYSFQPTTWPTTRMIFSSAAHADEPRPIAHAGSHVPPTLLVHGAADETVKPHNATEFAATLQIARVPVELAILDGATHTGLILGFARPFRRRTPVLARTLAFIHSLEPSKRGAELAHLDGSGSHNFVPLPSGDGAGVGRNNKRNASS